MATTVRRFRATAAGEGELRCRLRRSAHRHSPWRRARPTVGPEAARRDLADRRDRRASSDRRRHRGPARGPSGRRPTRRRAGPSASSLQDARGAGEAAARRGGAWRWRMPGRPRPARSSRRCRGRRGRGPPRGEANRGRRGRSASPPARRGARGPARSASLAGDGDLEAVLAGVAGAGDMAVDCRRRTRRSSRAMKPRSTDFGQWRARTAAASGPCSASSARSSARSSFTPAGRRAREIGVVDLLAAGIDDETERRRRRRRRSERVTIRSSTMPPASLRSSV